MGFLNCPIFVVRKRASWLFPSISPLLQIRLFPINHNFPTHQNKRPKWTDVALKKQILQKQIAFKQQRPKCWNNLKLSRQYKGPASLGTFIESCLLTPSLNQHYYQRACKQIALCCFPIKYEIFHIACVLREKISVKMFHKWTKWFSFFKLRQVILETRMRLKKWYLKAALGGIATASDVFVWADKGPLST